MKNNYSKNKHCKCGKLITNKSVHCKHCANTNKNNPQYIDGRTLKKYYCFNCNKKISYSRKLCLNCLAKLHKKENNNNWKGGTPKCVDCGKRLKGYKGIRCRKCANSNNPPNWRGGKSFEEYGKEFDSSLKEQVRFRDKYKCRICGCSQLENRKHLDVHHIDYNKKNNILNNLISLCIFCHRKTNGNREYWTNYFKNFWENLQCQILKTN